VRDRFALAQISLVALMRGTEVLMRVAILHEFARHSRHKTEDDFPHWGKVLELGYKPFIYIRDGKSSVVEL
jgi:hypothetical protein